MKKQINPAVWAAIAVVSLTTANMNLRAAEEDIKKQDRTSQFNPASDKTLGEVERANKLIGKQVRSSDDQKVGKIEDIVLDLESGRVLYAVVGSGGILGAGEKKIPVPPALFSETRGDNVRINVDKQKFTAAPEFTKDIDKDMERGKAEFVSKVYDYFGQTAWWQGGTAASTGTFNNVHKASDVIGMKIQNAANEPIGKVDNIVIDLPAGRVVYAILAPGRNLELGNNLYALPPNALTLSSDRKSLVSDISKEKLTGAPHFEKDNWPNLANPTWGSQVYQYYGKQAYFEGGTLRPTSEREKPRVYPDKK
jgi:sporulation protein YlmC with PRC-barrel domain